MADTVTSYASPGTVSGTSWTATDAGTLVNAVATANAVWATHAAPVSDFLSSRNFNFNIPANQAVSKVEVNLQGGTGVLDTPDLRTVGFFLTLDGSTPYGSEVEWDVSSGSADVAGLMTFSGLKLTSAQVNSPSFGILCKKGSSTTTAFGGDVARRINLLQARLTYAPASGGGGGGQNVIRPPKEWHIMDHLSAARRGYKVLDFLDDQGNPTGKAEEAMPSVATAAAIFAKAPPGTKVILLTLRTAGITMRFDGGAPTAGANGQDFAADPGQPYVFYMDRDNAKLARAIATSGSPTGWITYLGLAG